MKTSRFKNSYFPVAAICLASAMAVFIVGNLFATANAAEAESAISKDDAYAAKVWKYMEEN